MSQPDDELFAGLRELAGSAFSKRCRNCGREYRSLAEFLSATRSLNPERSGLKQSLDDDGQPIVDLFRNCVCGSTLMESFNDRRDLSAAGLKRRRRFDELLTQLVSRGVDRAAATAELKKLMRGEAHDLTRLIRESAGVE